MGNDLQAKKLKDSDILYISEQTFIPVDQVRKAYQDFESMCLIKNDDSEISYNQFEKYFKTNFNKKKSDKFILFLFQAFDRNSNDKLSFLEFLIGMTFFTSDDHYNNLKIFFNLFDLNKDNCIQKNEIHLILSALKKLDVLEDENEFLKQLDLNNDGSIDEDEFIYGIIKNNKYKDIVNLGE